MQISARAFQRVFTCKNRRRYSRERAPRSLGGKFNSIFTSLLSVAAPHRHGQDRSSRANHVWALLSIGHVRDRHALLKLHRVTDHALPDKNLGDLYAESGQTLQGSFSAVSTPTFASKYHCRDAKNIAEQAAPGCNRNRQAKINPF